MPSNRFDRQSALRILAAGFLCFAVSLTASDSAVQYLFPSPGSENLPQSTPIIMRFWDIRSDQIGNPEAFCTVSGERSGPVPGRTIRSSDGVTLLFKPDRPFRAGETVTVRIRPFRSGEQPAFADTTFRFRIETESMPPPQAAEKEMLQERPPRSGGPARVDSEDPLVIGGVSVPSTFPVSHLSANSEADPHPLFVAYSGNPSYLLMFDNTGGPIWYERLPHTVLDFKLQKDGRLTYYTNLDIPNADHVALDSAYAVSDTFYVPEGYVPDMHELQVMPDGHYFIIGNRIRIEDLSGIAIGGNPQAQVICNHVIEMDADDNPVFIWSAREHLHVRDAVNVDFSNSVVDFSHVNAVEVDLDGHLLVSCRHLETVIKINRQTGQIMWQLGGAHDDFTWINDVHRLSYQHDIRVLPNGHYTLFDNGNYHSPPLSRALELLVNTTNWTVTKIWDFEHPTGMVSMIMGSVQRLKNGNTLINWGFELTEVRPDGSVVFSFEFEGPVVHYRSFRFDWNVVSPAPSLIVEPEAARITLLFNKFGDPDVHHYNVYVGSSPHPDRIAATSEEPFIHLTSELTNNARNYFRTTAVNGSGAESPFSNEESVWVQLAEPGRNLIRNGDFAQGTTYWQVRKTSGAQAVTRITGEGQLHLDISSGGTRREDISLRQGNLPLVQDVDYRLECDIRAESGRLFEIAVCEDGPSENPLMQSIPFWITENPIRLSFDFSIRESSTGSAQLVFNAGGSSRDLYLDNILLRQLGVPAADFTADVTAGMIPLSVQFTDASEGVIDTWSWDFGDGNASAEQHPVHVYQTADTFDVTLTVSGPGGESTRTERGMILASDPSAVGEDFSRIPEDFALWQNYPNPFNAFTVIRYAVPVPSRIRLAVYNVRGECVAVLADGQKRPRIHQALLNASRLSSGIYLYKMDVATDNKDRPNLLMRKMVHIK